jgi:hypothetical protein
MELEGFNEWLRNWWERSSSGEVFCSSRRIPNFSCIVDFSAAGGGRLAALVRSQSQIPRHLGASETGAFTGDPPLLRLGRLPCGATKSLEARLSLPGGGHKTLLRQHDSEADRRHRTKQATRDRESPFLDNSGVPEEPTSALFGAFWVMVHSQTARTNGEDLGQ